MLVSCLISSFFDVTDAESVHFDPVLVVFDLLALDGECIVGIVRFAVSDNHDFGSDLDAIFCCSIPPAGFGGENRLQGLVHGVCGVSTAVSIVSDWFVLQ